jgi:bacterioferritin (cytochrome b1)
MDVEGSIRAMNEALTLQYRSALAYTLAAGSLTGFAFQPMTKQLSAFGQAELEDARHLIEKIVTLGGQPTDEVAELRFQTTPSTALKDLIENETEAIDALQAVIPHSGQEGRSEALEHRMEHIIMRKQEQVDALIRAVGPT